MAQVAADVSGDIGPFQLAIFLTVVTLVLILGWRENYGKPEDSVTGIFSGLKSASKEILRSPEML